jgi:pilus assembly protein CpaD
MKTHALATAAALALAAGACAHKPPVAANAPTSADQHRIAVSESQQRLELAIAAGDTALSAEEQESVEAFARLYVRQGHGALVMTTPAGGANAESAALISRDVRMRLASSGVPFSSIAATTVSDATRNDAPIVLNFTRYSAEGPACEPLWKQDLAHASDNQPWSSFGCAQQANLAAMISDPHDLVAPRSEDPRDAARRARVLEAYRQGQQTHAERSNDERVQVSDAVR